MNTLKISRTPYLLARHTLTVGVLTLVTVATGCATTTLQHDTAAPQSWEGKGAMFLPDGTPQGNYEIVFTRTVLEKGHFDNKITIKEANGKTRQFTQRIIPSEHGFQIKSKAGDGVGHDLGNGMFTTYTQNDNGSAFASSIFMDENKMRILRYELKDGQAVKIFSEQYSRP